MIKDNLAGIKNQIANICKRLGRDSKDITLVGVTKFAEVPKIDEAIAAGLRHIAENKVQEGQRKYPAINTLGNKITRHLIGHLQSNKAKQAVELFDLIHAVDSFKLSQEIAKQAAKMNKTADILVQVSTSGEEQKFGVEPAEVSHLLEETAKLSNIRVLGLMTMAPLTEDKDVIRKCFRDLKVIFDETKKTNGNMKYLSMGMSGDFEIALEEGSNMVRIGSAIFKD